MRPVGCSRGRGVEGNVKGVAHLQPDSVESDPERSVRECLRIFRRLRAAARIYRLPLFVTRDFKSSTFARIDFRSGEVFASL